MTFDWQIVWRSTVMFESDLNLSAEEAWGIYSYRWEIEIMMRFYKEALCFDEISAHNDYLVLSVS